MKSGACVPCIMSLPREATRASFAPRRRSRTTDPCTASPPSWDYHAAWDIVPLDLPVPCGTSRGHGAPGHLLAACGTPTHPSALQRRNGATTQQRNGATTQRRNVATVQRHNLPASLNKSFPIGWFAMIAMSASCGSPAFSVSDSASPTSDISVGNHRRRCPTAVPALG